MMRSVSRTSRLLLFILAVAALLAGCRGVFWAPDSRRLAIDHGGDLRIFDTATSRIERLDTRGRFAVNPVFAPDGKRLAYYGIAHKGRRPERIDLLVRDLVTGKEQVVVGGVIPLQALKAQAARVAPKGAGAEDALRGIALMLKSSGGPAWSPDGKRLVHTPITTIGATRLEIIDVSSRKASRPTSIGSGQMHASWSPDGAKLMYVAIGKAAPSPAAGDDPMELVVAAPQGQSPRRLWDAARSPKLSPFIAPHWASDSAHVLVYAASTPKLSQGLDFSAVLSTEVWSIPISGGKPQRVIELGNAGGCMAPSRQAVAYFGGPDSTGVLFKTPPFKRAKILDWLPQPKQPLLGEPESVKVPDPSEMVPWLPVFSPDEKRLALLHNSDDGGTELRIYDLTTLKRSVFAIKGNRAVLKKPEPAPVRVVRRVAPEPRAALVSAWKTSRDVKSRPAREVLGSLAAEMGLELQVRDRIAHALARPVTIKATGRSYLNVMEAVAAQAGLYPLYSNTAVGFAALPRPRPAVSAGPFHLAVEKVTQYAGAGTGRLSIRVLAPGLPPGAVKLLAEAPEADFQVRAITGRDGKSLLDTTAVQSGHGSRGDAFDQLVSVPFRGLLRKEGRITKLHLGADFTIPIRVAEARWEKLTPGTERKLGAGRVRFQKVIVEGTSRTLTIEQRGLVGGKVDYAAFDAAGELLPVFGFFGSNMDGAVTISIEGTPASLTARQVLATEPLAFSAQLGPISLNPALLPERLVPPQFPARSGPVSLQYLATLPRSGLFGTLKVRATNHSDKDVRWIEMDAVYRDSKGRSLGTKSLSEWAEGELDAKLAPALIPRGKSAVFEVTAFSMPANVKFVVLTATAVEFTDAQRWKRRQ